MEEYYIGEKGFIICALDDCKFVSVRDFNGHKRSLSHRMRVGVKVEKPKMRKVNPREKIFNY